MLRRMVLEDGFPLALKLLLNEVGNNLPPPMSEVDWQRYTSAIENVRREVD